MMAPGYAPRRAAEHYGVALTPGDLAALRAQIQAGGTFRARQSRRRAVHEVRLPDGRAARVVYDARRHRIVTFLPPPP